MQSLRPMRAALFCALFLTLGVFSAQAQTITHGPICGAVTDDGARFVIRTSAPTTVQVELSTDPIFDPQFLASTNTITTSNENDNFAIVDASGLTPGTRYYYRAKVNGTVASANPTTSMTQRFTTFPLPGSVSANGPFVVTFGSCQSDGKDPGSNKGTIFPSIAREHSNLFIQTGDWGYPDTTELTVPGDYFNMQMNRVQQSYRSKYQAGYPMDTLFVTTPFDYIYDDHDYAGDNSGMNTPLKENSINGYQAMFPHYPVPNTANGNWHKFTAGNAEFFVVDPRAQRVPNMANFEQVGDKLIFNSKPTTSMLQGDPLISGEKQMDWLISSLKASTATWKFIVSGTAFNPAQRATVELALALQGTPYDPVTLPSGAKVPASYVAVNLADNWSAFPHDVSKLVNACHDNAIANVMFLTGDSHNGAIDDGTHSFFPELMAGSLDMTNSHTVALQDAYGVPSWQQGQLATANNYFNAYGRVSIFANDSVRLELVDENGAVIAKLTQMPGHIAANVGMMLIPGGIDFGNTTVGTAAYGGVIVLNTGGDSLRITNVQSTDPQFTPLLTTLVVGPGEKAQLPVQFIASAAGQQQAGLMITSNIPAGTTMAGMIGIAASSGVEAIAEDQDLVLYPNYPNPVGEDGRTMFMYKVKNTGNVHLSIVDAAGSVVRTLVNTNRFSGTYFEEASMQGIPNGNYLIRLESNGVIKTMKLSLVR